jgi:thioredoxin-related protein
LPGFWGFKIIKMKNKLTSALLFPVLFFTAVDWHYNLTEAENIAHKEHRNILLNFSGSDWCGPCIRMHTEIFESEPFRQLAENELVLVNADFPRNKKNQLPPAQQKLNDDMADKYNSQGKFPYTLLLSADGKVLHIWEGMPNESPEMFTMEVHNLINANP